MVSKKSKSDLRIKKHSRLRNRLSRELGEIAVRVKMLVSRRRTAGALADEPLPVLELAPCWGSTLT